MIEQPKLVLFVYGSYKRGQKHHDRIASCPFLGTVETQANYLLYDTGPWPVMIAVQEGEGRCIEGEIYEVSYALLEALDDLHDTPWQFERKPLAAHGALTVQGYVYKKGVDHFLDCGTSWPRT